MNFRPVTAKEAICELSPCHVTAKEAVCDLSPCPVTVMEAVSKLRELRPMGSTPKSHLVPNLGQLRKFRVSLEILRTFYSGAI